MHSNMTNIANENERAESDKNMQMHPDKKTDNTPSEAMETQDDKNAPTDTVVNIELTIIPEMPVAATCGK